MLELHEPAGAFARLEAYLREHGFLIDGGREAAGLCADVYLGYGLSRNLRRTPRPGPPEPAELPLLACRIRSATAHPDGAASRPAGAGTRIGEWQATWSEAEYARAIGRVREAIADGEVYQVNLVQHLAARFEGEPSDLAGALAGFRPLVPRPLAGDGWALVSASPELFLARQGDRLRTMPIKGTRPAGASAELLGSGKDFAEHVMIVDLERNDLGRVCLPGSVRWPDLLRARPLAGVEHLVSTVEGTMRPGVTLAGILEGLFPGGSVTGAPKIAAIDHIAALEPVGRGASMGALGVVWPDGDFELALTIRTFAIADGRIHLWVGGGVVWDSEPLAEVEESWVKARPLLEAIGAPLRSRVPA